MTPALSARTRPSKPTTGEVQSLAPTNTAMLFLVCYNVEYKGGSAVGDVVMTTTNGRLTPKSVTSMREWLVKELNGKGMKSPSVVFTSITKLQADEP